MLEHGNVMMVLGEGNYIGKPEAQVFSASTEFGDKFDIGIIKGHHYTTAWFTTSNMSLTMLTVHYADPTCVILRWTNWH